MRKMIDSKCVWLAGASALVMGLAAPTAIAQDDGEESTRTLATVTVTTQKTEESIQDVPIAVSAFDEDAINRLQLTGGSDLVKAVPNVSFTKGQFTAANFKIRGIGADVVAQSGDAGVGVHQNDVPLQSNRLFEAEFYDIERAEILRGPQGTLYGRNATGGVFNLITAKPVLEEFQADLSMTYGNYNTFKTKGMINLPIGDKLALRVAGSMTQRDGYVDNLRTGNDIDGRDLWAARATLAFEPNDVFRGWMSYEHFEEDDTRLRTGKQLCKKDPVITSFAGIPLDFADQVYTSQGCVEAPLSDSYEMTNSISTLTGGLGIAVGLLSGDVYTGEFNRNLRQISAATDPNYQAEQDLYILNLEFDISDSLQLTSLTSYNESFVASVEDANKFSTDITFNDLTAVPDGFSLQTDIYKAVFPGGVVSDPQLGPSNVFTTNDLSGGSSETFTQEIRLQSDFDGPFNFNLGAIYMDHEAIDPRNPTDGYYFISNTLSALAQFHNALYEATGGLAGAIPGADGLVGLDESNVDGDTNILNSLDGTGRNYFRSLSPFKLESTAIFGEGYFDISDDLKLTVGLRYTDDQKEQVNIPTYLYTPNALRPDPFAPVPNAVTETDLDGQVDGIFKVDFQEVTGRIGLDWSPDLSFTDDSLIYGFYSKGYKGGGLNPPQPAENPDAFPATFEPEFVNSFEIGAKNTFANGTQQLNATAFHYDYEGYQIVQIINRTSANFNIDATIQGLELEYLWSPADNWLLTANLGLLDSEIKDTAAVDTLDRTAGNPNFVVLKNAANYSNCVVSAEGYATVLGAIAGGLAGLQPGDTAGLCLGAFAGQEAAFGLGNVTYVDGNGETQTIGALTPFDGISKDLDGNSMPGAPEMTLNLAAEYTFQSLGGSDWDMKIRGDYYHQAESFSRVWNTGHDKLDSWSNVNLSIVLTNEESGWGVEAFAKNLTDEEVITGAYLQDDSPGLFTNIFLTEPALYGITVKKSW